MNFSRRFWTPSDLETFGPEITSDDIFTNSPDVEIDTLSDNTVKIIFAFIGCFGTIGNIFVISVILSNKSMKDRGVNILIMCQSFIDLTASCFVIINNMVEDISLVPDGVAGEIFCRLWLTRLPLWGMMCMSSYNLVAMGIERYIAIVFPFKYKKNAVRKKLHLILFVEVLCGFFPQYTYVIPTSRVHNGACNVLSAYAQPWIRYI